MIQITNHSCFTYKYMYCLCVVLCLYIYICYPPHPYSLFALRMKMQPWRMEFRCKNQKPRFPQESWGNLGSWFLVLPVVRSQDLLGLTRATCTESKLQSSLHVPFNLMCIYIYIYTYTWYHPHRTFIPNRIKKVGFGGVYHIYICIYNRYLSL